MPLVPILRHLIREHFPHSRYLITYQSARYRIPQLSAKTALIGARGSSIKRSVTDTCERDIELMLRVFFRFSQPCGCYAASLDVCFPTFRNNEVVSYSKAEVSKNNGWEQVDTRLYRVV
jgi:hypothetical protein